MGRVWVRYVKNRSILGLTRTRPENSFWHYYHRQTLAARPLPSDIYLTPLDLPVAIIKLLPDCSCWSFHQSNASVGPPLPDPHQWTYVFLLSNLRLAIAIRPLSNCNRTSASLPPLDFYRLTPPTDPRRLTLTFIFTLYNFYILGLTPQNTLRIMPCLTYKKCLNIWLCNFKP